MIHIEKGESIKDNENLRIKSPSGDYDDADLIEFYDVDDKKNVSGAFQAQYVKYGGMVYMFNSPKELGEAILKIDPESTHTTASYVRMTNELLAKMNGGTLEVNSLQDVVNAEQASIDDQAQAEEKVEETPAEETSTEETPATEEEVEETPEETVEEPEEVPADESPINELPIEELSSETSTSTNPLPPELPVDETPEIELPPVETSVPDATSTPPEIIPPPEDIIPEPIQPIIEEIVTKIRAKRKRKIA